MFISNKIRVTAKRIVAAAMCVVFMAPMFMSALFPVQKAEAATLKDIDSDNFQLFLANYLKENPTVNEVMTQVYKADGTESTLANHIVAKWVDEDLGITVEEWRSFMSDWTYPVYGREAVYEQIIRNLLDKMSKDDLFTTELEGLQKNTAAEVIGGLLEATQNLPLNADYKGIKDFAVGKTVGAITENKLSMQTLMELNIKTIDENRDLYLETFKKKKFAYSLNKGIFSYALSIVKDTYELAKLLTMYGTLKTMADGICSVLDDMYRKSTGDVQTAVATVRVELTERANDDVGLIKALFDSMNQVTGEQANGKLMINSGITIIKTVFASWTAEAALLDLFMNVGFNVSSITKAKILLHSQVEVERLICDTVKLKSQKALNDVQSATAYNYAVVMLFESMDYGQAAAQKYGDAVVKSVAGRLEGNVTKTTVSAEEYDRVMKTYKGAVDSAKTIFASAWREFKENNRIAAYSAWDALVNVVVSRGSMDALVDAVSGGSQSPDGGNGADSTGSSGDGSGSSESGSGSQNGSAGTTVTDIFGKEWNLKTSVTSGAEDYTKYYVQNSDGITLTEIISECVEKAVIDDKAVYIYHVPEYVDGYPVTSVQLGHLAARGMYASSGSELKQDLFVESDPYTQIEGMHSPKLKDSAFLGGISSLVLILPSTAKRLVSAYGTGAGAVSVSIGQNSPFMYKSIVLNDGLESIEAEAFCNVWITDGCLTVPSTVSKISEEAFYNSRIDEVVFTGAVSEIPNRCFQKAWTLRITLEHPEALQRIGDSAFETSRLTTFSIPDSVREIGERAFANTYNLVMSDKMPASIEKIGDYALSGVKFAAPCDIDLYNAKNVGAYAFENTNVRTLVLPSEPEYIGEGAFKNCNDLIAASKRDSVSATPGHIGADIFKYDQALSYLELPNNIIDEDEIVNSIGDQGYGGHFKYALANGSFYVYDSSAKKLKRIDYGNAQDALAYLRSQNNDWYNPDILIKKSSYTSENPTDYIKEVQERINGTQVAAKNVKGLSTSFSCGSQILDSANVKNISSYDIDVKEVFYKAGTAMRKNQLGIFDAFEDSYLCQEQSYYLTVGATLSNGREITEAPGDYQLKIVIDSPKKYDNWALYHITPYATVERIACSIGAELGSLVCLADVSDIGCYCLVRVAKLEERVDKSEYLEEYHSFWDEYGYTRLGAYDADNTESDEEISDTTQNAGNSAGSDTTQNADNEAGGGTTQNTGDGSGDASQNTGNATGSDADDNGGSGPSQNSEEQHDEKDTVKNEGDDSEIAKFKTDTGVIKIKKVGNSEFDVEEVKVTSEEAKDVIERIGQLGEASDEAELKDIKPEVIYKITADKQGVAIIDTGEGIPAVLVRVKRDASGQVISVTNYTSSISEAGENTVFLDKGEYYLTVTVKNGSRKSMAGIAIAVILILGAAGAAAAFMKKKNGKVTADE